MKLLVDDLLAMVYASADFDLLSSILAGRYSSRKYRQNFDVLAIDPDALNAEPKKQVMTVQRYSPITIRVRDSTQMITIKNLFYQGTITPEFFMKHSCTDVVENHPVNLVLLGSGELALLDTQQQMGYQDIIAVIQFSSHEPGLSRLSACPEPITVKGIDCVNFKISGFCQNCKNLVFIPPIPEGVESLRLAFKGCLSLNCPIFLPESIRDCTSMLEGVPFSSKIYLPSPLKISDVEGLQEYSTLVGHYS